MYNEGLSIELSGKRFEKTIVIKDILKAKQNCTIIYGRNGSGKTTISRAFNDYKNDNDDEYDSVKLKKENMDEYDSKFKKNIFVYN